MKKTIVVALALISFTAQAQIYHERIGFDQESISHIDIGWMSIYKPSAKPTGKQLGNRTYSARQIGYSQQFMEWMQQSYIPRGCLGKVGYYQNYIPKFNSTNSLLGNAINSHAHALPHLYGAYAKIYLFLKKDAQGKFVPQNNLGDQWNVEANGLQYISNPVSFISSAEEYYFLLPDYSAHPRGHEPADKNRSNLSGFETHPNIRKFIHFFTPPTTFISNPQYIVILSKNNELPFEKITIGEFLKEAETQFPVWQKIDPLPESQYSIAKKNLARLKEKYRNNWFDIAEMPIEKAEIKLIDFANANEGGEDIFDNRDKHTCFPVLKVKKTARELCKTDQPQWVVIRWSWGMENQPYFIHFHESILNNFNFDYVYNYFFDPEKVKGIAYKPLLSPARKETITTIEPSAESKKYSTDKNVFFFEDFSTTVPGKKPLGWQAKLAHSGTTAVVTKPNGAEGNWVELRGHFINATDLKKHLPQNFTLSYDLAAAENFTWGAKGLTMQLSKETSPGNAESYLSIRIRPGFDGRDGEVFVESKFPFPTGYTIPISKWYVAQGFSNNKKFNRITVSIKKMEETLQLFIDGKMIAEYQKAIPSAHLFNALSFNANGNSAETDKYFISNIKIVKE